MAFNTKVRYFDRTNATVEAIGSVAWEVTSHVDRYMFAPQTSSHAGRSASSLDRARDGPAVVGARRAAQTAPAPRCGTGVHEEKAVGPVLFPQDQIFCPTIADPKEPRSFISFLRGTFRSLDDPSGEGTSIASGGLGDSFGLVRWGGPEGGAGVQLDLVGSIFAQFDLGAPSNDLINADYIVGVPLTFRRRGFSACACTTKARIWATSICCVARTSNARTSRSSPWNVCRRRRLVRCGRTAAPSGCFAESQPPWRHSCGMEAWNSVPGGQDRYSSLAASM